MRLGVYSKENLETMLVEPGWASLSLSSLHHATTSTPAKGGVVLVPFSDELLEVAVAVLPNLRRGERLEEGDELGASCTRPIGSSATPPGAGA